MWQWATFSWMSQLVTGEADRLTKHVVDVPFKGESEMSNIKEVRISRLGKSVRDVKFPCSFLGRLTPAESDASQNLANLSAHTGSSNQNPLKQCISVWSVNCVFCRLVAGIC